MYRHLPQRDEGGAFLVIYALALVSILLFAALAIDLGNIVQTKQHTQNAADDAAVSAVGDLAPIASGSSASAQEQQTVDDVESFVHLNYSSITSSDWSTCPSNVLPPHVSVSAQSNCIGFFNPQDAAANLSDPTGIAVVIPGQTVKYSFGKVGGLTQQGISAVAEASVQSPGAGFLLPFGYAPAGGGGLECLKTGSGKKAAGCTGFAIGSGQFGVLDSPRYRICFNACPATSPGAGNSSVVMGDITLGIDHRLNIFTSQPDICDATSTPPNCTGYNSAAPYDDANSASPLTGQTLNDPGPALFNADQNAFTVGGCVIDTPRFSHPDGFLASDSCQADNPSTGPAWPHMSSADTFGSNDAINGVHITSYLVGGTTNSYFTSCYNGKGPGGVTPNPSVQAIDATVSGTNVWTGSATTEDGCLSSAIQDMPAGSPPIFTSAIASSPRFGVVPVVTPANGRHGEAIDGFLGVYFDMAFGTGKKVDAVDAWVFPLNLIQPASTGNGSGLGLYLGGPFVTNLCSLQAENC
jgi:Putative Flp pilus-assembly TadE/G-like